MPVGEGSLKKSFEILKSKLKAEGLFDEARKRALPRFPVRIGVVSSSQAAGYADFIKILGNRWGGLQITLADVTVQGMDAPGQIIGAIKHLNELAEPLDVLAVIRGGGSADDLAAFNHEDVVRAIASSRTPTIVGVGHEIDVSLADLAADIRAATPSNAAEIIVPDKREIIQRINQISNTAANGVNAAIRVFEEDIQATKQSIEDALTSFFENKLTTLSSMRRTLGQLDPNQVLRRGYSIVKKGSTTVSSTSDVIIGDEIDIQLKDGEVKAKVTHVI
jgi:exodeoxyribonuclease VII large subunit